MAERKHIHNKLLIANVLFIIAGLYILFLFPNETKFKYEFTKGKPWQHERLIAPFSFAINKTLNQIEAEKDSIVSNHTSYFVWDEEIAREKRSSLQNKYFESNTKTLESIFLDSILQQAYNNIIIDLIALDKLKQEEIFVIKNNESTLISIQNVYTPKKLFLELNEIIKDYKLRNIKNPNIASIDKVEIENFISSNIRFDEELTLKLLKQKLDKVSITTGLIQKGELIISTGEIIDNSEYEILRSYRSEYQKRFNDSGSFIHTIGNILIIATPLFLLFLFLFQYRKKILLNSKKTIFILSAILLFITMVILNQKFQIANIYLLPIAILPIIIRAFFDTRLANFIFITSLLLMAYIVPNSYYFIFIQLISGTLAIFSLTQITRRSHIFKTSLIVFLAYSITYLGMSMVQVNDWNSINWMHIGYFAGNALMITLSYPLVYLSEKVFGFTSDVTLLEVSDTNHSLLKILSEKAPGTFQHSLQVANIAEELSRSIGGNPLLVRAGSLYHDIGKLMNPEYFTENQAEGFNPHSKLTCIESAQIIIQHIPDGLKLAKKYNLPKAVVDFIPMHQGTMTTKFFLTTFKQKYPEQEVNEQLFTYPGPKPFSKETAVVMIADSIEAASRSLKSYTPESIGKLVDKIIDYQFQEKQFENVNMTFKDLNTIKQVLKEKLATIYHSRIEYPEEEPLVS